MKKEKGIIIGIVTMLTMIVLLSLSAYAGDISTSSATIDFLDDSNIVNIGDYKIDSKVIAVDSDGYTFNKLKVQYLANETICTKTQSVTDINGTKTTQCIETALQEKVQKEEWYVAELSFNNCDNGKWYRIYKSDGYYTEAQDIIDNGYRYRDVQCSDNSLKFYVDSFSSYTTEELDALQANNQLYYSFDDADLSGSNILDLSSNGFTGNNTNSVTTGATGIAGESFDFGGTNEYVNVGNNYALVPYQEATISFWIKLDSESFFDMIFTRGSVNGGGSYEIRFNGATNTPECAINEDASGTSGTTNIRLDYALNLSTFYHIACVFNKTGTPRAYMYINGESAPSTITTNNWNDLARGTYNNTISNRVGARNDGYYLDGSIDELGFWTRDLSSDEILAIYDINSQGYNIYNYPTNVSNTAPSGHSITSPANNQDYYNYFNTSVEVTWSNASDSESDPIYYQLYEDGIKLTNTTGNSYTIDLTTKDFDNYTLIVEACDDEFLCSNSTAVTYEYQEINYTSIFGVDYDFDNITINSVNYAEVLSFTFNNSYPNQPYAFINVIESYKSTGATANDLYVQIELDGTPVTEDVIARLSTIGHYRIGQNIPFITVEDVGEHTITVSARRTGTGNVIMSQFDVSFFQLLSTDLEAIYSNNASLTHTFNNQSYQEIDNFVSEFDIKQNINTVARLSFTATGATEVWCKLRDNTLGLDSPEIGRYLSSSSDTGIASFSSPSLSPQYLLNTSLYCYNSNDEDVTMDIDYIDIGLVDNASSLVSFGISANPLTNSSSPVNLTAGYYELASFNHTVKDGDYMFISNMLSIGSNTGINTPTLSLVSNSTSCNSTVQRTISSDTDIANIFIYHNCDGLSVGNTYSFSLNIEVPTGEEVVIYDEYFSGFETMLLNVSTQNVAPFEISILTPSNNSVYTNQTPTFVNVTWTESFDPNGDNITYNLYLDDVNINSTDGLWYNLNLSAISFANHTLIAEACDDAGLCTNSTEVNFEYKEYIPPSDEVFGTNFETGQCPVGTTPLAIVFLTICFVLTAFVVISYVLNSPFMMFGTGLGILICSWFIVGCVGGLGWIFIILGVGTLLYSMIGIKY